MFKHTRLIHAAYFVWCGAVVIALALAADPKSAINIMPAHQPWLVLALIAAFCVAMALIHFPGKWLEERMDRERRFQQTKERIHRFTA